jgi:hypothetical protein
MGYNQDESRTEYVTQGMTKKGHSESSLPTCIIRQGDPKQMLVHKAMVQMVHGMEYSNTTWYRLSKNKYIGYAGRPFLSKKT